MRRHIDTTLRFTVPVEDGEVEACAERLKRAVGHSYDIPGFSDAHVDFFRWDHTVTVSFGMNMPDQQSAPEVAANAILGLLHASNMRVEGDFHGAGARYVVTTETSIRPEAGDTDALYEALTDGDTAQLMKNDGSQMLGPVVIDGASKTLFDHDIRTLINVDGWYLVGSDD